jgi:hypothetical protein
MGVGGSCWIGETTKTQIWKREMNSKKSFGWRRERKKIVILGVGWEERGKRVEKTSTLPYTDLESFFRESLDIIAKVLLQIISYMLFQHLVLSPVVLCSGTTERKGKKHNKTPTTSSSSAVQKIHISSS